MAHSVRIPISREPLFRINHNYGECSTWRIIPFSKWLITMVSKSPKIGERRKQCNVSGCGFSIDSWDLIMGVAPQDGPWPLIHCQVHCLAASTLFAHEQLQQHENCTPWCQPARPPRFRGCVFVPGCRISQLRNLRGAFCKVLLARASSLGTCRLWPTFFTSTSRLDLGLV